MKESELSQEQSDRLAKAIIGEVVAEAIVEQQTVVDRCAEDLARAKHALAELRRARIDWTRRREVDYALGERVVVQAKIADFASSTAEPETHLRAVRSYFQRHPPKRVLRRLGKPKRWPLRVLRRR